MLSNRNSYLFTSESVSEGHPDKVADQISDAILDAYLAQDPDSRVALETLVTTNKIVLAGETRSGATLLHDDLKDVARKVVKRIGYQQEGFDWRHASVDCYVHGQSVDIAAGVDAADEETGEGAGDQGIMFGFATTETPHYMPAPLYYSHRILMRLADDRHSGAAPFLEPDSKSQVTLLYENGRPVRATSVVVSTQHRVDTTQADIRDYVKTIVAEELPDGWCDSATEFHINPTGIFVIGGPDGDCGLTGRKIIVDTYGGAAPHGGGAFSGKDPTKVDRSAAYACRYLAKNVVAAGLAETCVIQVAYAIGVARPLSLYVNCNGTAKVGEREIERVLSELVDLRPRGIRNRLNLNRPIYERTASYGHFGRDPEADGGFSWERVDLVDELKAAFNAR